MMERIYGDSEAYPREAQPYMNSGMDTPIAKERNSSTIISHLDEVEKMVEVSLQRLSSMADRLVGPIPEKEVGPSKLGAVPSGVIGEISARVENIERKLSYLGRTISRLEVI